MNNEDESGHQWLLNEYMLYINVEYNLLFSQNIAISQLCG